MKAVAAVTGDVWPPTHGRCTRVAGVLCALCRCGRMLITHLPHNTASHPPKQQPLQVQGSKIGPSCCAFSVLSCLQSEGNIMVIMPTFFSFGALPRTRLGLRPRPRLGLVRPRPRRATALDPQLLHICLMPTAALTSATLGALLQKKIPSKLRQLLHTSPRCAVSSTAVPSTVS